MIGLFSFFEGFVNNYRTLYRKTPDYNCQPRALPLKYFNTLFKASGATQGEDELILPTYLMEQVLALCHIMLLSVYKTIIEPTQANEFTEKRYKAYFAQINVMPSAFTGIKPFLNIAERVYNNFPALFMMTINIVLKYEHQILMMRKTAIATQMLLAGSGMTTFMEIAEFLRSSSTVAFLHPKIIEEASRFFANYDRIKADCEALESEWRYYKVFHPNGTLSTTSQFPNLAYCAITLKKNLAQGAGGWKNFNTNASFKNVDFSVKQALSRPNKTMKGKVQMNAEQQAILVCMGVSVDQDGFVDYDNYEEKGTGMFM